MTELKVVESVPFLDEAAKKAARKWKYEPARKNGVPIPMAVTLRVRFEMPD